MQSFAIKRENIPGFQFVEVIFITKEIKVFWQVSKKKHKQILLNFLQVLQINPFSLTFYVQV